MFISTYKNKIEMRKIIVMDDYYIYYQVENFNNIVKGSI